MHRGSREDSGTFPERKNQKEVSSGRIRNPDLALSISLQSPSNINQRLLLRVVPNECQRPAERGNWTSLDHTWRIRNCEFSQCGLSVIFVDSIRNWSDPILLTPRAEFPKTKENPVGGTSRDFTQFSLSAT